MRNLALFHSVSRFADFVYPEERLLFPSNFIQFFVDHFGLAFTPIIYQTVLTVIVALVTFLVSTAIALFLNQLRPPLTLGPAHSGPVTAHEEPQEGIWPPAPTSTHH